MTFFVAKGMRGYSVEDRELLADKRHCHGMGGGGSSGGGNNTVSNPNPVVSGQVFGGSTNLNLNPQTTGQLEPYMAAAQNAVNPNQNGLQQQGYNFGSAALNTGYGAGQQALGFANQVQGNMGSGYGNVSGAPNLPQVDMSGYTNPYNQQVVDATNQQINRQFDIQGQGLKGQAAMSGAFGGDRAAVQQAENDRNRVQQIANTDAGLYQQGYTQAQNTAETDLARQQQTQLANQQNAQANVQSGLSAAGLQNSTGQNMMGLATGAETLGSSYAAYPLQNLSAAANVAYSNPLTKLTTTNSNQGTNYNYNYPSLWTQNVGAGLAGADLLGQLGIFDAQFQAAGGRSGFADGGRAGYAYGSQVQPQYGAQFFGAQQYPGYGQGQGLGGFAPLGQQAMGGIGGSGGGSMQPAEMHAAPPPPVANSGSHTTGAPQQNNGGGTNPAVAGATMFGGQKMLSGWGGALQNSQLGRGVSDAYNSASNGISNAYHSLQGQYFPSSTPVNPATSMDTYAGSAGPMGSGAPATAPGVTSGAGSQAAVGAPAAGAPTQLAPAGAAPGQGLPSAGADTGWSSGTIQGGATQPYVGGASTDMATDSIASTEDQGLASAAPADTGLAIGADSGAATGADAAATAGAEAAGSAAAESAATDAAITAASEAALETGGEMAAEELASEVATDAVMFAKRGGRIGYGMGGGVNAMPSLGMDAMMGGAGTDPASGQHSAPDMQSPGLMMGMNNYNLTQKDLFAGNVKGLGADVSANLPPGMQASGWKGLVNGATGTPIGSLFAHGGRTGYAAGGISMPSMGSGAAGNGGPSMGNLSAGNIGGSSISSSGINGMSMSLGDGSGTGLGGIANSVKDELKDAGFNNPGLLAAMNSHAHGGRCGYAEGGQATSGNDDKYYDAYGYQNPYTSNSPYKFNSYMVPIDSSSLDSNSNTYKAAPIGVTNNAAYLAGNGSMGYNFAHGGRAGYADGGKTMADSLADDYVQTQGEGSGLASPAIAASQPNGDDLPAIPASRIPGMIDVWHNGEIVRVPAPAAAQAVPDPTDDNIGTALPMVQNSTGREMVVPYQTPGYSLPNDATAANPGNPGGFNGDPSQYPPSRPIGLAAVAPASDGAQAATVPADAPPAALDPTYGSSPGGPMQLHPGSGLASVPSRRPTASALPPAYQGTVDQAHDAVKSILPNGGTPSQVLQAANQQGAPQWANPLMVLGLGLMAARTGNPLQNIGQAGQNTLNYMNEGQRYQQQLEFNQQANIIHAQQAQAAMRRADAMELLNAHRGELMDQQAQYWGAKAAQPYAPVRPRQAPVLNDQQQTAAAQRTAGQNYQRAVAAGAVPRGTDPQTWIANETKRLVSEAKGTSAPATSSSSAAPAGDTPPVPGARRGKDPQGNPGWYIKNADGSVSKVQQ